MKKINKVVTALGNPKICNELKNHNINIIANDIQYQEGIIEFLENNSKINYLVIDENIPGNFKINELIYNIKKINNKIKIILISQSNEKLFVYKKLNELDIKQLVQIINNENVFLKKQIPLNSFFSEKTKDGEIITILGANGIGKTIFSICYAQTQKNKKILIMDFDILNTNIHKLFIDKENKKMNSNKLKKEKVFDFINIENQIVKLKNNIDFFSGINIILNSKNQSSPSRVKNIIKKLKKEYDYILVDTSTESLLEYTKEIIKISKSTIFISGANLLEVKKSKRLLEIYNKEWKIENIKINIVFNKCTKKSIDDEVLRNIFKNYTILGKIQLNEYYDATINKRLDSISKIEKEIMRINNNYNSKKLKINKIRKRRKHGVN